MLKISRSKFFNRYLPMFLTVVLIVGVGFFYKNISTVRAGYQYSRAITFQGSKISQISQTSLTNFTTLVCFNGASPCNATANDLKVTGSGGQVTNSNGYDIIFATDSACSSLLNWEVEDYVGSTGELEAWVQIPSLAYNINYTIYMCYGNSSISTFQGGSTGAAWDSNYKGVWHLAETNMNIGTTLHDSTSNGLNMYNGDSGCCSSPANTIATSTGMIDGAAYFPATSQYVGAAASSTVNSGFGTSNNITMQAWVNFNSSQTYDGGQNAFINTGGAYPYYIVALVVNNGNNSINFQVTDNAGSTHQTGNVSVPSLHTWYDVVATYDGSIMDVYLNGSLATSTASSFVRGGDAPLYFGYGNEIGARNTDVILDEARISNSTRSADWVNTEYNNQSSPSTFYSTSGAENVSPNFSYYRSITIDHTKVGAINNTDQSSFPVLVSGTYSYLATVSNGGQVHNSSGYDVGFYSNSNCSGGRLAWETESYNASTGAVNYWVNVPTVSHSSDTVFYMCYGSTTISTDQSNASAVWGNGFAAVYHLDEDAANTTVHDSTFNAINGNDDVNTSGVSTAGQIAGALKFNNPDNAYTGSDYVTTATSSALNLSAFTLSTWVKITDPGGETAFGGPMGYVVDATGVHGYSFVNDQVTSFTPHLTLFTGCGSGCISETQNWYVPSDVVTIPFSTMHYMVWVYDGTNAYFYDNGVAYTATQSGADAGYGPASFGIPIDEGLTIGKGGTAIYATVDETRVASAVRSADWVATEYNNQSAPDKAVYGSGGFYTIGSAQSVGASFSYSRAITFQGSEISQISHTGLSNFPALVCFNGSAPCNITAADLKTTANGGQVTNSNGDDIIFTSDSGCSSKLNWEVENYVGSTGELEAWVQIPSLAYNTNHTIYMCYGNSSISTFQGGATGSAWDSNYVGVYHFSDNSAFLNDSTANANNATDVGFTEGSGQIDGGADNGGGSGVGASVTGQTVTGNITLECWFYPTTNSVYNGLIDHGLYGVGGGRDWNIYTNAGSSNLYVAFGGNEIGTLSFSTTGYSVNAWNDLVVTANGSVVNAYLNGVFDGSVSSSFEPSGEVATTYFGGDDQGNNLEGSMDEARISKTIRSADWINTEYNNESSPSTFYSTSGAESVGGGGLSPGEGFVNMRGGGAIQAIKIRGGVNFR